MTVTEELSTYAMFMIMAAPPMLGCDIRKLASHTLEYVLAASERVLLGGFGSKLLTKLWTGYHDYIDAGT